MSDPIHDALPTARTADGRFSHGNPGRPPGARNRRSARFAAALLSDFEANEETILRRLRNNYLPVYMGLMMRLVPKDAPIGDIPSEPPSADHRAWIVSQTRAALDRFERGEGTWADLEAAMFGEASPEAAGAAAPSP